MADGSGACPTCSSELVSGAPFCHQCGTAITPGPVVMPVAPAPGPPPDKLTVVLDDLGDDPLEPGTGRVGVSTTGGPAPVTPVPPPPSTPAAGFAAAPAPAGSPTAFTAPMVVTTAGPPAAGAPVERARPANSNGRPRPTLLAVAIIVVIVLAASAAGAMVLTRGSGGTDSAAGSGGQTDGGSSASGDGGTGGSESGTGSGESGGGESGVTGGGGSDDDAFCAKVDEIEADLRAQAADFEDIPEDDPFSGLLLLLTTIGDLGVYMNELADVAPAEIHADMEVVAESFQQEATTDPMEILAGIVTNLSHANSFTRVDAYTHEHCGVTLFGPAPTT